MPSPRQHVTPADLPAPTQVHLSARGYDKLGGLMAGEFCTMLKQC